MPANHYKLETAASADPKYNDVSSLETKGPTAVTMLRGRQSSPLLTQHHSPSAIELCAGNHCLVYI